MILNHNLNPDLKWNANERFQFLKIGVVFMKMDLGGLSVMCKGHLNVGITIT